MVLKQRFFFCPMCGEKLVYKYDGEKDRLTCTVCGYIIYENPAVGVAVILMDENNRILLGKRNRGKKAGLWCIPCGYVDYDEDVYDAAVREFKEETGFDIEITSVFGVHSNFLPEKNAVGIWFMAKNKGGSLKASDDLDEADFFNLDNLPEMAFENDLKIISKLKGCIVDNA